MTSSLHTIETDEDVVCANCGGPCDVDDIMDPICWDCREDHPMFTELLCVNTEFADIFFNSGLSIPEFISLVESIHYHARMEQANMPHEDEPPRMQSDTFSCQSFDWLISKCRAMEAFLTAHSLPKAST